MLIGINPFIKQILRYVLRYQRQREKILEHFIVVGVKKKKWALMETRLLDLLRHHYLRHRAIFCFRFPSLIVAYRFCTWNGRYRWELIIRYTRVGATTPVRFCELCRVTLDWVTGARGYLVVNLESWIGIERPKFSARSFDAVSRRWNFCTRILENLILDVNERAFRFARRGHALSPIVVTRDSLHVAN